MPITPHNYSNDPQTFMDRVFAIIRALEQGAQFDGEIHTDGIGVPTIGYGYALAVRDSNEVYVPKEQLGQDLAAVGIAFNAEQTQIFTEILAALNEGGVPQANALILELAGTVAAINENQGRVLFDVEGNRALTRIHNRFTQHLGQANGDALNTALTGSREMLALVSMAYNGGGGLIGPNLTRALHQNDRAEAWFEIRYNTMAGPANIQNGLARRRYVESTIFGLYDGAAATELEARKVFRMLQLHRDRIERHEATRSQNLANANAALDDMGLGDIEALGLDQSLELARVRFIDDLRATYSAARLNAAGIGAIAASDIFLDPGHAANNQAANDNYSNPSIDATHNYAGQVRADADLLVGEGGNDTLSAGNGNDILIGGAGNDRLYGGAGQDTYVFRASETLNEGHDIIRDEDGNGSIVINDTVLDPVNAVLIDDPQRPGQTVWQWTSGGRAYNFALLVGTGVGNNTLTIYGAGLGNSGEIRIENYQTNHLGLSLPVNVQAALVTDAAATNPFSDPSYTPTIQDTTLNEGGSRTVTLALNAPGNANQTVRITVDALAPSLRIVNGAETLSFTNGSLDLVLAAGQNTLTFALVSSGDVDSDQPLQLTATLLDVNGVATLASAALSVAFDATDEVPPTAITPVNVIDLSTDPRDGTQESDRIIGTSGEDIVTGDDGDDVIEGRGGDDWIWESALRTGDDHAIGGDGRDVGSLGMGRDLFEGGAGADMAHGYFGNDQLFAEAQIGVVQAIAEGAVAQGIDEQGDNLQGAQDDDLLVGSSRNDHLGGGSGHDTIIGGGGNDFLTGDEWYTFGHDIPSAGFDFHTYFEWMVVRDITTNPDGSIHYHFYVTGGGAFRFEEASASDVIYAGTGNDDVLAGGGDDLVNGEAGDDIVLGEEGNDSLFGGTGNDVLDGGDDTDGTGKDFLDGGDGADSIQGGGGDDTLFGGAGNDTLVADDLNAADGNDYLNGEAGDDVLFGGGGSDRLYGEGGNDVLNADAPNSTERQGADVLDGGDGNDILRGGGGADSLVGGAGADQLFGDSTNTPDSAHGDDALDGGADDDLLVGDGGADRLVGGAGADQLWGDRNAVGLSTSVMGGDTLEGGDGADQLVGGGGADSLQGGAGNDVLHGDDVTERAAASSHGDDLIDGGAGNDNIVGWGGDDTIFGGEGDDTALGDQDPTQLASAFHGNDVIDGGAGNDGLAGQGGDDILYGGDGDDTLLGGEGNDLLIGGQGVDFLDGGAGDDTYVFDTEDLIVSGGFAEAVSDHQGSNRIVINGSAASDFGLSSETSSGTLTLSFTDGTNDFALIIQGALNGSVEVFQFEDGAVLTATQWIGRTLNEFADQTSAAANARLIGGRLADTLTAIGENAYLSGGGGNDTLTGGLGTTMYLYEPGDGLDTITDESHFTASSGVDRNIAVFGDDISISMLNLVLAPAASSVMLDVAGAGGMLLNHFSASDVVNGARTLDEVRFVDGTTLSWADLVAARGITINNTIGATSCSGTNVADRITGAAISEAIDGGSGDDTIDGGAGNDLVTGGSGSDTYVFGYGSGIDRIQNGDTVSGKMDRLSIRGVDAANIAFSRIGDSLLVTLINSSDKVLVSDFFTTAGLDEVRLESTGTTYTSSNLPLNPPPEDVIHYSRGEGTQSYMISDPLEVALNTVRFDSSISPADIVFETSSTGDLIVRFLEPGGTMAYPDQLILTGFLVQATNGAKVDRFTFAGDPDTVWDTSFVESLAMTATAGDNYIRGTAGADVIDGLGGSDVIYGLAGDDTLIGDNQNAPGSSLYGGDGNDSLIGGQRSFGGEGNDTITGRGEFRGDGGDDVLTATGDATLNGGTGSDVYQVGRYDWNMIYISETDTAPGSIDSLRLIDGISADDVRVRRGYYNTNVPNSLQIDILDPVISFDTRVLLPDFFVSGNETAIIDELRFASDPGTTWSVADLRARALISDDRSESILGFSTDDMLVGNGGDDLLDGAEGSDELWGGAGNDQLIGGAGNDTYRFGSAQGYDEISETAGVDRIVLDAGILPGDVSLHRTSGAGRLQNELLTPVADDLVVVLNGGPSQIRIESFFASTGGQAIESIEFANGTVWDSAAILSHLIDQSGTANVQSGTSGNDVFIVDHRDDVVSEVSGGGTDSVQSSVSFILPTEVENLTLTGILDSAGWGNAGNNVITGNAGDNELGGGYRANELATGADTLIGGAGDDVYHVNGSNTVEFDDTVIEQTGEGYDTLMSMAGSLILPDNVERLIVVSPNSGTAIDKVLTGNALDNVIDASAAGGHGLTLDGGAGADVLIAAHGPTTYIVDDTGDVVRELGGVDAFFTDTVRSSVTYTLGQFLENLVLTGSAAISGTGNSAANEIDGSQNAAANMLVGGAGNDRYLIGVGDIVIENAGEGIDEVRSVVSYTLGSNIESLTLTGTGPINGTGNAEANLIIGNSSANTLNGGGGADQLVGGAGHDVYVIDADDLITENFGGGTDEVRIDTTYTLLPNFETLTLTGNSAIDGTGNSAVNIITGNGAANTLNGGGGADQLRGGAGDDIFIVDNTGDSTVETASEGNDEARSSVTFTIGANVEILTLTGNAHINGTGNASDNLLTGNSGNNTLNGGGGADTLQGGAGTDSLRGGTGNDIYLIDESIDTVTENANEGTDEVRATINQTLATNVENLVLLGSANITATGNALANVLVGNTGNNTLNGLGGADSMSGGTGDDTYVVDHTGDTVSEGSGAGTDLVQSSVSYSLSANVENLTLMTTTAINATGNALDNILVGNSAANTLSGGGGNDTLNGGGGADPMSGGTGDDLYIVDHASDTTVENADEGIDRVDSSITRTLASHVEILFLTGPNAINGTGNTLSNLLRGNLGANALAGGGGNDILEGGDANDALSNSGGNNLFNGGAGVDTITGNAGTELFIGGAGNDTLTTGAGADIIAFNRGGGSDIVNASTTQDNTLSLGNGILYADLLFQKTGNDLILLTGSSEQITLKDYYLNAANRSIDTLQIVIEGTSDYDSGSSDETRNKKIGRFDFDALVGAFDAARAASPTLTTWALTNALAAQNLGGSDTAALGGDLAYRYGRFNTLSDISFTPALAILASSSFGTSTQALQAIGSLQDSSVRLS